MIEYFEKPITKEEKAIAEILEKMDNAIRSKNIDALKTIISDRAQIAIFDKNWQSIYVNKEDYIVHMESLMPEIRKLDYKNALIRIINDKEATITCSRLLTLSDPEKNIIHGRYFKFQNENGAWRLTEATYIGS